MVSRIEEPYEDQGLSFINLLVIATSLFSAICLFGFVFSFFFFFCHFSFLSFCIFKDAYF